MAYLYVDSSSKLTVGILSAQFEWIEFKELESTKSSGIVHGLMDKLLSANGIAINQLDGFIYVAGPGSYTGMRVAEGIAQIFEWQKIKTYSFYHFEVPAILNIESGSWIADAFKKELFCYRWDSEGELVELISVNQLDSFEKEPHLFTHFIDKFSFDHLQETSKLICQKPRDLFSVVVGQSMKKKPYYYRALDQDFKKPN